MSAQPTTSEGNSQANWRIRVGLALFITSLGWVVVLPVMPFLGFTGTQIATLSGVMVLVAELLMLAGAAVAGKEGFAYIKSRVFGFFKAYGPPQRVSRTRYRIGLVMFFLSLLLGWLSPYAEHFFPALHAYSMAYAIVGDVLLLASLFVLCGDFWNKLRALFVHDASSETP